MAKYDALGTYLARRGSMEVELAFEEVERIIGDKLPEEASRPQWWASETDADARDGDCKAWHDAGYDAFLLPRGHVLFRRRETDHGAQS